MVEMASRATRKLADDLNEKKVLSSDCTILFARLERDIDAYVKGAASVGTGGLSGIGNRPMPVAKSRRESRFKAVVNYVGGLLASRRVFCWLPFAFFCSWLTN